jgi:uncharacterized protein
VKSNPCLDCGACCAHYRVSFHWSEAEPALGGATPAELTTRIAPHLLAMRGTEWKPARCGALEGAIGLRVRCTIYATRPSACRELEPSWRNGMHNERCDRARIAHGLPPLERPHRGDASIAESAGGSKIDAAPANSRRAHSRIDPGSDGQ